MFNVRIDNQSYDVSYGFQTTYTLDKTLDFGSFTIPAITRKQPFQMYSTVEITRDDGTIEYFLVSGDIVAISSYNPLLYSHTVQFVEYTKKLETYLISAATFTQPTDGTTRYTYYDVIDRLVKISVFETQSAELNARPCILDNSLLFLNDYKSPEFFFYNKTLREAIDEVLASLPAISRLKRVNGIDTLFVDYFDIQETLIDEDFLSYQAEQNINNYSTTMISDVSNSIRGVQGAESIAYYPAIGAWAPLTTQDGVGVIDDTKTIMNLQQPIYDVVQLLVKARVRLTGVSNQGDKTGVVDIDADLSRFIVSKEQYESLRGSWENGPTGSTGLLQDLPPNITQAQMIEQGILNKQNAIWFERGTPFIQGLTTDWRSGPFTGETNRRRSLENALLTAIDKSAIASLPVWGTPMGGFYRLEIGFTAEDGWQNFVFNSQYIPQERSNRVEVERQDLQNFARKASAYFKQNANLINLNAYLNKMSADLQRTGEETYVVKVIHPSYSNLLSLGDYTEDGEILVSYTLTQEYDHIDVVYNLTDNYQQINEMIAVDKSNDFFELVNGNKVLDRFVIYKDYVIVSDIGAFVPYTQSLLGVDAQSYYVKSFVANAATENIEAALFNETINENVEFPLVARYYQFDMTGFDPNEFVLQQVFPDGITAVAHDLATDTYYVVREEYAGIAETLIENQNFIIDDIDYFGTNDDPANRIIGRIFYPNKIYMPLQTSGSGSSLLFTGNFNNNANAGFRIIFDNETGGFVQVPVFYAENGELESFNVEFINRFNSTDYSLVEEFVSAGYLPYVTRNDYDVIITNNDKNLGPFKLYKDPGERLKLNYQIQAVVAPQNMGQIILGNYFSNYNGLVFETKEPLFLHYTDQFYSRGDVERVKKNAALPNGIALDSSVTFNTRLNILNSIPENANSYGVSDAAGRLLFAVNKVDGNLPTSFNFIFSHTRPGLQKL